MITVQTVQTDRFAIPAFARPLDGLDGLDSPAETANARGNSASGRPSTGADEAGGDEDEDYSNNNEEKESTR